MLEFRILGPLDVRHDDRAVVLGSPRGRALLAVLLVHHGEAVAADALVQALWGDEAPATAAKALHVSVSRLRRALGPAAKRLQTIGGGYRLLVEGDELDAARFKRGYEQGRRLLAAGHPAEAVAALHDALALWRGPALADFRYESWAQAEMRRLEELRAAALEESIEAELALGEHARLLGDLEALVAEHPLRERLRAQQMLALYRSGRHADALAVFRAARAALDAELGLEPGPELRALEQAILTHDPALLPRHVPPAPPTPTIGREGDVRAVLGLLADARLLTLTGTGGVGKTRLAIEVARAADGRFVSLASISDAERIPSVICDTLAVARVPGEQAAAALDRAVGRGRMLLVLDNLEHLPGAAPLLARLLERQADLRVLATSRQPLRIRAERLYPVRPLDAGPAAALFADRARARDPSFVMTDETALAVARICDGVGRLPLAIELAAARLGVLTPAELAERLGDSLAVLDQGPSDVPERQRTLRATLDWSFDLLDEPERDAFAALATFAGGCELDAAETVAATVPVLEGLVGQSLVTVRDGRLTMLEPVRQYAAERLAQRPDADALRARHLDYYLALAERAEHAVWAFRRSGGEYAVLRREHDNLRAAVEWGLHSAPALRVMQLVSALACYLWLRGASAELRRWWGRAFERTGDELPPPLRARALLAKAFGMDEVSDRITGLRAVIPLFREAGDDRMTARCLVDLATYLFFLDDQDGGRAAAEQALTVAVRGDDDLLIGAALGEVALGTGDAEAATPLARAAADRLRAAGARVRSADLLSMLGLLALRAKAYDRAEQLEREALDDALAIDDPWTIALVHGNAGLAAFAGGRLAAAEAAFRDELTAARGQGFRTFYFEGLLGLAALAAADRDDGRAAVLAGAAWALNDRPVAPSETPIYEPLQEELSRARERLGEPAWCAAEAQGRRMTAEVAMAFAFESATTLLPE